MQTGIIKEIKDNKKVIVNLDIINDCTTCSLNKNCINQNKNCENLIEAVCENNVEVGDRVKVNISTSKKIFFMFLIFFLPIIILFFSFYLFKIFFQKDFYVILLSFVVLVLYFFLVIIVYKINPSFLRIKCYKIEEN